MNDCHYRTGNIMIRERLEGQRNPKLRKSTDKRKVGMFFFTMKDKRPFLDALEPASRWRLPGVRSR